MINKVSKIEHLNHDDQPELCFHNLLDGKGRLTIIRGLSQHDSLRYTEFTQIISDISLRVLSLQLKELENLNIIVKVDFNEYPKHTEYHLTSFGHSLVPIIDAIVSWYSSEYKSCDCAKICANDN